MILNGCDESLEMLITIYVDRLKLPTDRLLVTTSRATYRSWIGRTVPSAYGGAYAFLRGSGHHAILINVERIDTGQPRALEVVVAEELVHMRDHLDGDHRRHAHHGHDRIAHRVSRLTGASLDEIRAALRPVKRRPPRYLYQCPGCGLTVPRRRTGTWSCRRCSPRFDRRYQLRIVQRLEPRDESGPGQ